MKLQQSQLSRGQNFCLFSFLPQSFTEEFAPSTNFRGVESSGPTCPPPAPPLLFLSCKPLSSGLAHKQSSLASSFELAQELHVSAVPDHTLEMAESLPCQHLPAWCEDPHLDAV